MTIEDSLRGHFLRTFRRRIAKARGAELSIEVAELQLLLDLVEPLDAQVLKLRAAVSPQPAFEIACETIERQHPGLLAAAGSLSEAIDGLSRSRTAWRDIAVSAANRLDSIDAAFGQSSGEECGARLDEARRYIRLRIEGAEGVDKIDRLTCRASSVEDDSAGEAGCGQAVCLDANGRDGYDPRPIKVIDDPTNPGQKIRI